MKAIEIKAPNKVKDDKRIKVFLAGSIEQGKADDWQSKCVEELTNEPLQFLNPRRDNWDSSLEQTIKNKQFNEQVTWELDGIELADYIFMYFDKDTKSPITLLELGIIACNKPDKLLVVCPEGFWRKGNVDIVCKRYGVRQFKTLEELITIFKSK